MFNSRKVVSIPYGSIKSEHHIALENERVMFQFLMVRLKASCVPIRRCVYGGFNSLWFD